MATKTTKTTQNETPEGTPVEIEHDADEFLTALDEEGNPVRDEDIIEAASRPVLITWRAGGFTHRAELRFDSPQLSHDIRRKPAQITRRISVDHEIQDETGAEMGEDAEKIVSREEAEKLLALNEALENSEELRLARAQIAVCALALDKAGRPRVSVPQWRDNWSSSPETNARMVATDTIFGNGFIRAAVEATSDFFSA